MVEVIKNYEIKNESTFRIGGIVEDVALPKNVEELIELLKTNEYDFVLGNCSNILFSSDKINKKIILTKNISDFEINNTQIMCGFIIK